MKDMMTSEAYRDCGGRRILRIIYFFVKFLTKCTKKVGGMDRRSPSAGLIEDMTSGDRYGGTDQDKPVGLNNILGDCRTHTAPKRLLLFLCTDPFSLIYINYIQLIHINYKNFDTGSWKCNFPFFLIENYDRPTD